MEPLLKRSSTIVLQAVVLLIGIGALAFLLWEPHVEGRNAHATLLEIYFKDPFLAYVYVASIPMFVGLYQTFKTLECVRHNRVFSQATVKSLRTIRVCATAMVGCVAVGEVFILLGDSDDRAGGVFMGLLITSASVVVAIAATILGRILRSALDARSQSDSPV